MFLYKEKVVMTEEEKILDYLNKSIKGSKIVGDCILLNKYGLLIQPSLRKINNSSNVKIAELSIAIRHKYLNEPFIELVGGIGKDLDEAINNCVLNFSFGTLDGIKNCINGKYSESFETNFFGQQKKWKLTKSCIHGIGESYEKEHVQFWDIIKHKIKLRLGNKKIYWIKLYFTKLLSGEISCECTINGILNVEITKDITDCVKEWNAENEIYSFKQYFILVQDSETYNESSYSEEKVREYTKKIIKILCGYDSTAQLDKLDKCIYDEIENANLAYEIRSFIPEIFCELVFSNVNYSDKILMIKENKKEITECYKSQFISYNWIYDEVLKNYKGNNISETELRTILLRSKSFGIINQALNDGRNIEDLGDIKLVLHPSDEYTIA